MSEWKQTQQKFLEKWTLENVQAMNLEEYTNLDREDSFTYWLERKTDSVLGIGGGSSYKFGIFKRNKLKEQKQLKSGQSSDGEYGWYAKYGNSKEEVFQRVKELIIEVITAAQNQNFGKIDEIDLGDAIKWKIAFLYAPKETLLRIASKKAFLYLAKKYQLKTKKISEIQKELIKNKNPNEDFYDFSSKLWDFFYENNDENREEDGDENREEDGDENREEDGDENREEDGDDENNNGGTSMLEKQPLNKILYGPPGTGKTYKTINKALEILLEKEPDTQITKLLKKDNHTKEERELLKAKFEEHKKSGQIEFVTFHQSYGYEEFVEGIRAQTIVDDETKQKTITYDIEAGIFKRLCEQAKQIKSQKLSIYDFDEKINIWKISLGDSQNSEDDYLFDYCINNNKILLGFGDYLDFTDCKNRQEIAAKLNNQEKYSYPPTAINTLKNKMKKDDIVLVSYGNKKLRAIAKITEEYQHLDDENLNSYVQSRGVEWLLIPEEPFSYEKVLKKQFSQMSIYNIKSNVKIDALKNLLTKKDSNPEEDKSFILIIDEINRGNISKIFGELITLIEPSKRIGADEELKVKLPYSGDEFGVPQNLYIIGTMNTADRSIALMDTALRRRFEFTEMMPDLETLNDIEDIKGVKIKSLLKTINKRIEYLYDRDHIIGHAYFMELKDEKVTDKKAVLENIFRNKIIPLLQEYFYDDWEKIQIVLGDHINQLTSKKQESEKSFYLSTSEIECINKYRFVQSIKFQEVDVIGFDHEDIEDEQVLYKISNDFEVLAYRKIYAKEAYQQIKEKIKSKINDEDEAQTNSINGI